MFRRKHFWRVIDQTENKPVHCCVVFFFVDGTPFTMWPVMEFNKFDKLYRVIHSLHMWSNVMHSIDANSPTWIQIALHRIRFMKWCFVCPIWFDAQTHRERFIRAWTDNSEKPLCGHVIWTVSVNWHRCKLKNHCQTEQCHNQTQCSQRHNNESYVRRLHVLFCLAAAVDSI